jgi:adenine-specific DNA-methyltransferase
MRLSRLTELLTQAKAKNAQLGTNLERELKAFSVPRAFGLNVERYRPEAVELPSRVIRERDKVRLLPVRGKTAKGDQRLWSAKKIEKVQGVHVASVTLSGSRDVEPHIVAVDGPVVVVELLDLYLPRLMGTGRVERGGDKPFRTVINAEHHYALKALTYAHWGKADAIFLDPPYHAGAKGWKYNNESRPGQAR